MRRFIFLLMAILTALPAWCSLARITVNGNSLLLTGQSGVDYVIITDAIDDLELSYNGKSNTQEWYKITNLSSAVSNMPTFYPEDGITYLLKAGNDSATIAVIDYSKYIMNSLKIDQLQINPCEWLSLTAEGPVIQYNYLSYGVVRQQLLARPMLVEYTSLSWNESAWVDTVAKVNFTPAAANQSIQVTAPLHNTSFCLHDCYADSLGMTGIQICTEEYTAVAVACKLTYVTVARNAGNEMSRPDSASLQGSGPLEIAFKSNPTPAVKYYEWRISKGTERIATRQDENTRYTFQVGGASYTVGLTVSNDSCVAAGDSVSITVNESMLQVPNVFTPNGDGKNDEFRVAYKSLKEFHGTIFNRWGRKVFDWSDPQKGWNGRINGSNASPGVYFYIIKAVGEDGKKYSLKGDINLIGR